MSEFVDTAPGAQARTGRCLCGEIRFVATGELIDPHICGCEHCSTRSGSAFQWWVGFPASGFEWTSTGGEPTWYDTHADKTKRGFCRRCGTHLAAADYDNDTIVGILVTTIDGYQDDPLLVPTNLNRLAKLEAAPWLAPAAAQHTAG